MPRIRPRTKQFLTAGGLGALVALLICMIAGYFIINYLTEIQKEEKAALQKDLDAARNELNKQLENRVSVYVLNTDIKAGQKITEDKLAVLQVPKTLIPDNVVPEHNAIGKFTKFDLKQNTALLEPMLYKEGVTPNDLRRQELKVIMLPIELKKNDFVDVRIVFPDGQDFIVLSKKKVKNLANGVVWYEMDETEILRMSSAIVDAYINDAQIYALKYVDPYVQEKAIVTYPANQKVLDLIARDPNIVRKASVEMEKRMRAQLEKDLESISPLDLQKYVSKRMNQNPVGSVSENEVYESDFPPVNGGEPTSSMKQNIVEEDISKEDKPVIENKGSSSIEAPAADETSENVIEEEDIYSQKVQPAN